MSSAAQRAPEPVEPLISPAIRPVVAGLMLSMFLVALDGTIVSTAMPSIIGSLGGFRLYAWVPSIYLLTTAVSTPIYGKLADLFGRKRVLFLGIGLFLLGSVTSGAAPSMIWLIAFRAIQGLGAGAVQPVTTTIIADIFTLEQRARAQGYFSSVWGISSVLGPLVGGGLVDAVGWRWIFYLNVPFGLLATVLIWRSFHEASVHRRHKIDLAGITLLTVTLTALLLLLIQGGQAWPWASVQTAALGVTTVAALVLFIVVEMRADEPALPLDLFRSRIIAVSSLGMFFAGVVMINVSYEVPLYIQGVRGSDALHAGLALAPMSIGWPLAGSQSGKLAIRFGYRSTSLVGLVLVVVGTALLLTLGLHSSFIEAAVFSFIIGVGMGSSSTPMLIAVQSGVAWARRGVATGTTMFVRSFGGVVGLALMGAIINRATGGVSSGAADRALQIGSGTSLPPAVLAHVQRVLYDGIHAALIAALVAAVLSLGIGALLPGGSAKEHEYRE